MVAVTAWQMVQNNVAVDKVVAVVVAQAATPLRRWDNDQCNMGKKRDNDCKYGKNTRWFCEKEGIYKSL